LYLLDAALLTGSLAISSLLFNLAIQAFGYSREFIGVLDTVSIAVAALLSLPLWWSVTRIGLRPAMLLSAAMLSISSFTYALWPDTVPLLFAVSLTGMASVLFQVSSAPFMMRHCDDAGRDHLFSANAAINIGVAGLGSFIGGRLPGWFGPLLDVGPESPLAYRAAFAVAGVGLLLALVPLVLIRDGNQGAKVRGQGPGVGGQGAGIGNQSTDDGRRTTDDGRRTTDDGQSPISNLQSPISNLQSHIRNLKSEIQNLKSVIPLLIPPFIISWGAALLMPFLNLFFKERFAIGDDVIGTIFATLSLATGVSALLGPIISMRIGKLWTIVLMQALSIPFLLTLGFAPILGVAIFAAMMRAALFNMAAPLYDAFAMEQTEERMRPIVIGLVNGAYTAGYLFAPLISTNIQSRYGFAPLFVATTICYLSAMLANYWLFIHPQRKKLGNDAVQLTQSRKEAKTQSN
jgi:MFS family permease